MVVACMCTSAEHRVVRDQRGRGIDKVWSSVEARNGGSLVSGFHESAVRSCVPHHITDGSISDVDPVGSQQTSLYRNLLLHGRT